MRSEYKIQLNAPAGDLPSLIAAVDAGADSVYIGFQSATNLRNLPGLNFSVAQAAEAVDYAHQRDSRVLVTVNTLPMDHQLEDCFGAVDNAAEVGADAVIVADLAVLDYTRNKYPDLEGEIHKIESRNVPFHIIVDKDGMRCVKPTDVASLPNCIHMVISSNHFVPLLKKPGNDDSAAPTLKLA